MPISNYSNELKNQTTSQVLEDAFRMSREDFLSTFGTGSGEKTGKTLTFYSYDKIRFFIF